MVACRYGISLLVFNSASHSFAALTHKLSSWTLEEKFHIYARPCIILYLKLLLGKFMVVNQFELTLILKIPLKILHDTFYISHWHINLEPVMKSTKLKAKYVSSLWLNDTDNCYSFRGFLKISFESPSRETLIRCR